VTAIRRIGDQLEAIDDPKISDSERAEAERRLGEEIDTLWRTAQMRTAHVRPLDEVRSFMAVFDETLFRMVPEVLRALDTALGTRAPAFLRFGSWIGGDRDGNPAVTPQVTAETMAIHAEQDSLAAAGAPRLASGELQHLVWQAQTFGFHLAELEVRQHSNVHERALIEISGGGQLSEPTRDVLDTLGVVAALQSTYGVE